MNNKTTTINTNYPNREGEGGGERGRTNKNKI
jgi:hypothetical protein